MGNFWGNFRNRSETKRSEAKRVAFSLCPEAKRVDPSRLVSSLPSRWIRRGVGRESDPNRLPFSVARATEAVRMEIENRFPSALGKV